jgi:hypothetical protein
MNSNMPGLRAILHRWARSIGAASAAMALGCLVKVTTRSSGARLVETAYVVSEHDADRAVNIIKSRIAALSDEVVVVSHVSEELLHALSVAPGGFTRADGRGV